MYLYGRRSLRLTVWLLAGRSPHQVLVIVGGLGVALLALGNGESQQLVGACFLSLGAFAFASTLWLSMRADAKGVRVVNAFRVYRVPWNKVDLIASVQRERALYAPGHVEIRRSGTWALPDGYSIKVGATAGLDDDARAVVVAALLAEARVHGFNPAQAAGRQWEIWRTPRPQGAAPSAGGQSGLRPRLEQEIPDQVRCAICGRHGRPVEMEPFGQAGEPAWYCRDSDACNRRVAEAHPPG